MPPLIKSLIRVVERDMAPSLIMYFIAIACGTFYVIATIFAFIIFVISGVLVIAYWKNNHKLIVVLRIALFGFTLACFLILFIDDMVFKDFLGTILAEIAGFN